MAVIKSFNFFLSYHEVMKILGNDESGELIKAMSSYMFEGIEPTFENDKIRIAWTMIKPHLDVSLVRSSNGRKGGKKSKEKQIESNNNFA